MRAIWVCSAGGVAAGFGVGGAVVCVGLILWFKDCGGFLACCGRCELVRYGIWLIRWFWGCWGCVLMWGFCGWVSWAGWGGLWLLAGWRDTGVLWAGCCSGDLGCFVDSGVVGGLWWCLGFGGLLLFCVLWLRCGVSGLVCLGAGAGVVLAQLRVLACGGWCAS